ncbi:hypothetical protein BUALT_Bualt12G0072000 [Buddleja alternifolia]|uniref:DUF659 domain-containing protein n=1 Tax=Buddleja alternifolia TaxID=168488 RepID=A0AAV6WZZ4_9LAMI|nr:hypothetical protein BUALT_Bualt12G0072000 [Buddleja alternifolia]
MDFSWLVNLIVEISKHENQSPLVSSRSGTWLTLPLNHLPLAPSVTPPALPHSRPSFPCPLPTPSSTSSSTPSSRPPIPLCVDFTPYNIPSSPPRSAPRTPISAHDMNLRSRPLKLPTRYSAHNAVVEPPTSLPHLEPTCHEFSLRDLGGINYFLGLEVMPTTDGVLLCQRNYIRNLLLRAGMQSSKAMLYGGYCCVFVEALGDEGDKWDLFRVVEGEFPKIEDLQTYEGFVVSGSPFDSYGNDSWIVNLCFLLQTLVSMEKKFLGICTKLGDGFVKKKNLDPIRMMVFVKDNFVPSREAHLTILNGEKPPMKKDVILDNEKLPVEKDVISDDEKPPTERDVIFNDEKPPIERDVILNGERKMNSVGDTSSSDGRAPNNWPLWQFVTKLGKSSEGGGNQNFTCNLCNVSYKGSYSRVKAHLLKLVGSGIKSCPKVTVGKITEMSKLEGEAIKRRECIKSKMAPFPHSMSSSSQSSFSMSASNPYLFRKDDHEPKKRKTAGENPIEKAFNSHMREELDDEIARMFYSSGLPFNLARNPHYVRAFTLAAISNIAGYVPPDYNALRTKLLTKERTNLEGQLVHTKDTWRTKGVSLVCDGWTNPQRRPLINFMAINENGSMFIRVVNCQGEFKDKWFISNLIKEVIIQVGVTNVVQVVTDNAPVCKVAGLLVEETYPHIFWIPCVVHTLNLALKNICAAKNTEANDVTYVECHWITQIIATTTMIRNFINNHSMRLSMFNEFSKLKLLSIAETRERWTSYRDDDFAKARLVKENLLDDMWWDQVDYIIAFSDPIYEMPRICDTDTPCLHLVFDMWDTTISKVKASIYKRENKRDFEESTFWNVYKQDNTKMWDVGGDDFETFDDVGILGIASLSIDEPELESDIFVDKVGEVTCGDRDDPSDLDK